MKENIKLSSQNSSERKRHERIFSQMENPFNIPQLALFKI